MSITEGGKIRLEEFDATNIESLESHAFYSIVPA
jgi:hypothetical protein